MTFVAQYIFSTYNTSQFAVESPLKTHFGKHKGVNTVLDEKWLGFHRCHRTSYIGLGNCQIAVGPDGSAVVGAFEGNMFKAVPFVFQFHATMPVDWLIASYAWYATHPGRVICTDDGIVDIDKSDLIGQIGRVGTHAFTRESCYAHDGALNDFVQAVFGYMGYKFSTEDAGFTPFLLVPSRMFDGQGRLTPFEPIFVNNDPEKRRDLHPFLSWMKKSLNHLSNAHPCTAPGVVFTNEGSFPWASVHQTQTYSSAHSVFSQLEKGLAMVSPDLSREGRDAIARL